jgi:hypothetical protein
LPVTANVNTDQHAHQRHREKTNSGRPF